MKSPCKSVMYSATSSTEPCMRLGPYPATAVAALSDLGLTDQEIAVYFRVQPERIRRLRMKGVPELRHVCGGNAVVALEFADK